MTVSTFLLTAIIISVLATFFEGYIVFKNLKNKLHAYLFLNCIAMFISNSGYLLQLLSKTEDAYIAALKFSYAGRVWIVFTLFMFAVQFAHIRIHRVWIKLFILLDVAVYATIYSLQEHTLYYSKIWFDKTGMFPVLLHRNGIVHKVFMRCQIVAIVFILICLIRFVKNHKGKIARKRANYLISIFILYHYSRNLWGRGSYCGIKTALRNGYHSHT